MTAERQVKIIKTDRGQMVRIPRGFELPGEHAVMRKESERLVIVPRAPRALIALLKVLKPIDENVAMIGDAPPKPVDL